MTWWALRASESLGPELRKARKLAANLTVPTTSAGGTAANTLSISLK